MNWKESFKNSLVLFGITLLFGLIYFVLKKSFRNLNYVNYLWIPTIIVIILIPLIYAFFIKKSIKELIIITILFILISTILSLPIMGITKNMIRKSKGSNQITIFVLEIFSMNPATLIDSPICIPYLVKAINNGPNDKVESCPLQKYGLFIELIILLMTSFIIVIVSMTIGNYLSRIRKSK